MKKKIFLSLLLVNLITIYSCNNSDKTENSTNKEEQKTDKVESMDKDAKISAILDINKKPVQKLTPVELKLILKQGKEGLKKADITLDLTMPSMTMPKNIIKMKESLGGVYNADAIFTMSGDWRIYASVKFNGKTQDMYFDINVK